MVLLTMTDAMVAAIRLYLKLETKDRGIVEQEGDPSPENPVSGQPISHGQIIAISKYLRELYEERDEQGSVGSPRPFHLDELLRGSKVYIKPPKPRLKAPKTSEYLELMARLRKEEEIRNYERMINPPPAAEIISQRFAGGARTNPMSIGAQGDVDEADEITYADINRQMALIINILVSIVACSVALWMAASHWSTPKRVGLSMGGSGMIGVAEVVVYTGYLRKLQVAKDKGKKEIEVKEIIQTWVIGGDGPGARTKDDEPVLLKDKDNGDIRQRKGLSRN